MTTNTGKNVIPVAEDSLYNKIWDFLMGPTPIDPEEKMKEIHKKMSRLRTEMEVSCDVKSDDLKRLQKSMATAAKNGNEHTVREEAKKYLSLERQHKKAALRLERVNERLTQMDDIRVNSLCDTDMIDFIECSNTLSTRSNANPRKVARVLAQFERQQDVSKVTNEMLRDALPHSSDEENSNLSEENEALENLVNQVMSPFTYDMLNHLPVISSIDQHATINTNPQTTANKIQQFLDKK